MRSGSRSASSSRSPPRTARRSRIDGQKVAQTPLRRPFAVEPGRHEVRFDKPGMTPQTSTISVIAGQSMPVVVRLRPVSGAPAARPVPTTARARARARARAAAGAAGTATSPRSEHRRHACSAPPETDASGRRWMRPTALGTAIGAVVALGAGVTFQLLSSSNNNEFNAVTDAPRSPDGRCNERIVPDAGGPRCNELRNAADRNQTIAVAAFVTSGILAVGSAALYLIAGREAKPDSMQALRCRPEIAPAGLGAGCTFAF